MKLLLTLKLYLHQTEFFEIEVLTFILCVNKINTGGIRTVWLNRIAWNRNVFDNQAVYSC